MEKDDSCGFCRGSLRLTRRNTLRVVKCDLCGWIGPTLPPVPRVKLAPGAKAVKALRYPKRAVQIAHAMGVRL
jgi:hypothetical protein